MDILYLLIPLSALLVLLILALFGWALNAGQFDDLEREGERILAKRPGTIDNDQSDPASRPQQSASRTDASD